MSQLSKHATRRQLLQGIADGEDISLLLARWFETPLGARVLRAERAIIEPRLERLFGYHVLQLGGSEQHSLLHASSINHKIQFARRHRPGAVTPVARLEQLPLESDSIDVIIIHHGLDFADDSHTLLREASRVLRPGGHLLVLGFNPVSQWGLWKLFKRGIQVPWSARFLSVGRLQDWFRLLDLHVEDKHCALYFPPFAATRFARTADWLERVGTGMANPLGGVYLFHCVKQVMPITPIVPRWRPLRARPSVLPATENVRAKTKLH
jgi:SAM-dependent methyltransferase